MWTAVFIVPLIYLANAFLIGRLIKRIKISSNGIFNFILGFFIQLTIMYVINILLYTLRANIWGYALAYGIFQILLAGSYIFNWKYLIYKPEVRIKQLIIFFIVAICVITIGYFSIRNLESFFGKAWATTITDIKPSLNNTIFFTDSFGNNFSTLNISNIFWANIFKISKASEITFFADLSWTIIAAVMYGLTAAWIITEIRSVARIAISTFLLLFIVITTLAFIETYAIPDSWLLLEIFVYILIMLSKRNTGSIRLFSLTMMLMSILATTSNAYFIVIALYIFTIYWAIRNNENSISYILFLLWPVILVISGFISFNLRYFMLIMSLVYFVVVVIMTIVFSKIGTTKLQVKLALGISKHSKKIVYTALAIFLAIILVSNLFIFYEKYNFQIKNINYRNFLTFIYRIIWNIRIDNDVDIAIINAVLYTLFISLVIAFIVLRNSKKNKGYWFTKDVSVKLGIVSIILFCNPLVIHMFNIATRDYSLNTTNMNMLLFLPFIVYFIQISFNYKYYPIEKWNYYWI